MTIGSADRFRALAGLSDDERRQVRAVLGGHPLFRLYFESGLAAADAGDRSRSALLGRSGAGAVLAIEFDGLTVRTVVGELDADELAAACRATRQTELHVAAGHLQAVSAHCRGRLRSRQTLRYYHRPVGVEPAPDPRCRRLTAGDYDAVAAVFAAHYPTTVFSRWMLNDTQIGLFEAGELAACGGVLTRHAGLSTVNLGNFLTLPARRGEGLARAVMGAALAALAADGIRLATLGTTAENRAAWRSYEAMGFTLLEERVELLVGPG